MIVLGPIADLKPVWLLAALESRSAPSPFSGFSNDPGSIGSQMGT